MEKGSPPLQGYAGPRRPTHADQASDDVDVNVTTGGVKALGEDEVAPERRIRATWVVARRGDEWLITAYQNTPLG